MEEDEENEGADEGDPGQVRVKDRGPWVIVTLRQHNSHQTTQTGTTKKTHLQVHKLTRVSRVIIDSHGSLLLHFKI
jgi:hypothetical protein